MFTGKRKKNRLQLHRQATKRIGRRKNSQVNTRYQGLLKKYLLDLDVIEVKPQHQHQLSIKTRIIKISIPSE